MHCNMVGGTLISERRLTAVAWSATCISLRHLTNAVTTIRT